MVGSFVRRGVIACAAILGAEAAYAILKPAPDLEDFDPSGEFGDLSNPILKVAVVGDSSVTAPGVAGPEEIWVSILCRRLAERYHVNLRSFAVGGSTARTVVEEQLDETLAFSPDVVFVSVGANDALRGIPLRTFRLHLDHLIEQLTGIGAVVIQSGVGVLGTIPRVYPPLSGLLSFRAQLFDDVHRQVARIYGAHVVDQRSDDEALWRSDRSLWAADDFHVSAAGHARWADTAWKTVGPLLNGSGGPG